MYKTLASGRNQRDFQERLQQEMARSGMDILLLTDPTAVAYATGVTGSFLYGSKQCGNMIAVVPPVGKVSLIVSQFEYGNALHQAGDTINIIPYPVWIYVEDFDTGTPEKRDAQPDALQTFKIAADVVRSIKDNAVVGVQRGIIPYDKYRYLIDELGEARLKDCTSLMVRVKNIKFPWEIEMCRYTAEIAEKTMQYVMQNTHPGMSEVDIVCMFEKRARELTGGHELVSVNHYHTVGPCYWPTLSPREYILQEGDIVRLDGGVNVYGYRSDIARTYAVGSDTTDDKKRIFDTLLRAFEHEKQMLVPGAKLSDIFRQTLEVIRKAGYTSYIRGHFGHQTGLTLGEDFPMVSEDSNAIVMPGMVFCLEVPFYGSKHHSYNIEDQFVITENGHEQLTHTNTSLIVQR